MSVDRKYLAHYLDSSFDPSYTSPTYVRLGKDLEEYNDQLNPDVEITKNIIGEQSVKHNGYEISGDVDPYYTEYDDALSTKIWEIINNRLTGDDCKTSVVDVLLRPSATAGEAPTVVWAYREDVYVVPSSAGGDTSGVQTPFTIYRAGNRVSGTWNPTTKTFTPGA